MVFIVLLMLIVLPQIPGPPGPPVSFSLHVAVQKVPVLTLLLSLFRVQLAPQDALGKMERWEGKECLVEG